MATIEKVSCDFALTAEKITVIKTRIRTEKNRIFIVGDIALTLHESPKINIIIGI
jgi:hypothetical protein